MTGFDSAPPNGAVASELHNPAEFAFPAFLPFSSSGETAVATLPQRAPRRQRAPQQQPRIEQSHWPEIAARAKYESLRNLAAAYGVSHETIRTIVKRVAASAEPLAAD